MLFSIDRSGSFHQTDGPRWKSDCRQGNGFCRSSVLVSKSHSLACNLPLCCLRAARNNSGPEFQTCLAPRWGERFPAQLEIFLFLLPLLLCSIGFSSAPWLGRYQQRWVNNEEIYSLVFWQLLNRVLLRSCLYLFYQLWSFFWKAVGVKCLLKRILAGNYFWAVFMINLIKNQFFLTVKVAD